MARRTLSTKAKVITGLIYALAAILLVVVVYTNLHPTGIPHSESPEETTTVSVDDLPYNKDGSDKYANIEPAYKIEEVSIKKDAYGTWNAYVNGQKAANYTGVAKNEYGWFFIRDGEVDFNYNGIAGNEKGNWYIRNGKLDFKYTGTFTVNSTTYKIVEGQVVEE